MQQRTKIFFLITFWRYMCIFFKDKKSKKVKVSKKNPEIKFEIKNASKAPHPRTCQKLIYKKYFFGY
jgi:hypothetical protein